MVKAPRLLGRFFLFGIILYSFTRTNKTTMKNKIKTSAAALIVATILFSSFKLISEHKASPAQLQGLYIYYQSTPAEDYNYIGTIKAGVTFNGQPEEMINSLIKQTVKKYPSAEGIIITPAMDKADAISYK